MMNKLEKKMSLITFSLEKSTRNRWLIVVLLLLTAAGALALRLTWPINSDGAIPEANQPQALWQSLDIDSYRYTLTVSCFCPQELLQPVTVEVINSELASLIYADDGAAADPMFFEGYTSINKLHQIIADATAQNPARLDIIYDDTTGVPLNVDIDISELMADEEIRFTVDDFERLP
jgi:hypothetical protein